MHLASIKKAPLIFVAGPYSAKNESDVLRNVQKAERLGQDILRLGGIPVIPHKITSFWDDQFKDWQHEDWLLRFSVPLLLRCDAIAMVDGWEHSKGALIELATSLTYRIPRLHNQIETLAFIEEWEGA